MERLPYALPGLSWTQAGPLFRSSSLPCGQGGLLGGVRDLHSSWVPSLPHCRACCLLWHLGLALSTWLALRSKAWGCSGAISGIVPWKGMNSVSWCPWRWCFSMLLCMACLPGTLTRCFRVRVNSHRVKVLILGSLPHHSSSLTLILSKLFQFGSSEPAFETYVKNPSVNAGGSTLETGLESDPSSPPPPPPSQSKPPSISLPTSLLSTL